MTEKENKYGSWRIVNENGRAIAHWDKETYIYLTSSQMVKWEGSIGHFNSPRIGISGICLFDGSWLAEFEQPSKNKNNPPARRSLALPREREDLFKRLEKGKKITKIWTPISQCPDYHHLLLQWEFQKAAELGLEKLFFHLPRREYQKYILELEEKLGRELPTLYSALEEFTTAIKAQVKEEATRYQVELEFLSPMEEGMVEDPNESFLWPYLNSHYLASSPEEIVGVEDLVEFRLALAAAQRTGIQIPVVGAVLDIPHPYLQKNKREEEEVKTVEL